MLAAGCKRCAPQKSQSGRVCVTMLDGASRFAGLVPKSSAGLVPSSVCWGMSNVTMCDAGGWKVPVCAVAQVEGRSRHAPAAILPSEVCRRAASALLFCVNKLGQRHESTAGHSHAAHATALVAARAARARHGRHCLQRWRHALHELRVQPVLYVQAGLDPLTGLETCIYACCPLFISLLGSPSGRRIDCTVLRRQ